MWVVRLQIGLFAMFSFLWEAWLTIMVGLVRFSNWLITKEVVVEPDLTKPLRKNLLSAKTRVDESGSCYALGKRDHIIGGTHCCSANQLFLLWNLALKASSKSQSRNITLWGAKKQPKPNLCCNSLTKPRRTMSDATWILEQVATTLCSLCKIRFIDHTLSTQKIFNIFKASFKAQAWRQPRGQLNDRVDIEASCF